MCKKIILTVGESDKLVVMKDVEKVRRRIRLRVLPCYRAVIIKDGVVDRVYDSGEYKPFTKSDKKSRINVAFVNIEKSQNVDFNTRQSQVRDKVASKIYNVSFSGNYTFSVRNERKFLATNSVKGNEYTSADFALNTEREINSNIFSYITEYFAKNNISYSAFEKNIKNIERDILVKLDKYLDDTYGIEVRSIKLYDANISLAMELK